MNLRPGAHVLTAAKIIPRLAAACALAAGVMDATAPAHAAERQSNAQLDLISFGSLHGEFTDCGCKSEPKGGLPHRLGIIDSLHAAEVPFLHLDLGNFTSELSRVNERVTRFLWDAMAEMEVDATTPGPRELEQWGLYRELVESDLIPVVSSNLRVVVDGAERPIGQTSLVIERNGIKIGLLGLIGGIQFTNATIPEGIEIHFMDPFETARQEVARLREEAEVVVLLSQMNRADTDRLVTDVPGIDVALYGSLPAWKEESGRVGETITQETGSKGQYVGHLSLVVDPQGKIVHHTSKNAILWTPFPKDEEMAKRVEALRVEIDAIRKGAVGAGEE